MSASTFEACLNRFHSADPSVRRESAEALVAFDQSQSVAPLIEGLKDENAGVQEAAMAALIRIGGRRVVSSLLPLLRQDARTRNLAVEVPGVGRIAILQEPGGAGIGWMTPVSS